MANVIGRLGRELVGALALCDIAASLMSLIELARNERIHIGNVGPVFCSVFNQGATLDAVLLLEKTQLDFVKRYPKMFSVSIIVGDRLALPPTEVREHSARLQKNFEPYLTGAATVLLTTGLASAIARSFLAMHALVSPVRTETATFRSISEMVAWAKSLPNQLPEIVAMTSLVTDLEKFAGLRPDSPARVASR